MHLYTEGVLGARLAKLNDSELYNLGCTIVVSLFSLFTPQRGDITFDNIPFAAQIDSFGILRRSGMGVQGCGKDALEDLCTTYRARVGPILPRLMQTIWDCITKFATESSIWEWHRGVKKKPAKLHLNV